MTRAERRAAQAAEEAAQQAMAEERPNEPATPLLDAERCPGALGRRCDYTMRGHDGIFRCWTCSRRQPGR